MSGEGVCRTVPATPGPLTTIFSLKNFKDKTCVKLTYLDRIRPL